MADFSSGRTGQRREVSGVTTESVEEKSVHLEFRAHQNIFQKWEFSNKQKLWAFITITLDVEGGNSGLSQVRPDGKENPRDKESPETSSQPFMGGEGGTSVSIFWQLPGMTFMQKTMAIEMLL